jgi:hypothetical protein
VRQPTLLHNQLICGAGTLIALLMVSNKNVIRNFLKENYHERAT